MIDTSISDTAKLMYSILWAGRGRHDDLHVSTMLGLWKTLIRPKLEYGIAIWGPSLPIKLIQKLDTLQASFIKRLFNLPSSSARILHYECGLPSFLERCAWICIRYWNKIMTSIELLSSSEQLHPFNITLASLMRFRIAQRKPLKTHLHSWYHNIHHLFEQYNLIDYWTKLQVVPLDILKRNIQERRYKDLLTYTKNHPTLYQWHNTRKQFNPKSNTPSFAPQQYISNQMYPHNFTRVRLLFLLGHTSDKFETSRQKSCILCNSSCDTPLHLLSTCTNPNIQTLKSQFIQNLYRLQDEHNDDTLYNAIQLITDSKLINNCSFVLGGGAAWNNQHLISKNTHSRIQKLLLKYTFDIWNLRQSAMVA